VSAPGGPQILDAQQQGGGRSLVPSRLSQSSKEGQQLQQQLQQGVPQIVERATQVCECAAVCVRECCVCVCAHGVNVCVCVCVSGSVSVGVA
jgi:hypothetical protein